MKDKRGQREAAVFDMIRRLHQTGRKPTAGSGEQLICTVTLFISWWQIVNFANDFRLNRLSVLK